MINAQAQRYFFVENGVNKTTGSQILAKGKLMIADVRKPAVGNGGGIARPTNISTVSKTDKRFKILLGEDQKAKQSRSYVAGAHETPIFSLSQIKSVKVHEPKNLKSEVDEVIVGWSGRQDDNKGFKFTSNSKPFRLNMVLEGGKIPYLGLGTNKVVVDFVYPMPKEFLDACTEEELCKPLNCGLITQDIVKRLKRYQIQGTNILLDEVVDIIPNISCATNTVHDTYSRFTLDVVDTGDLKALQEVRASYPTLAIKRVRRRGAISTYETVTKDLTVPDFTTDETVYTPTCDVCPEGWALNETGYIYAVSTSLTPNDIEDYLADNSIDDVFELVGSEAESGRLVYLVRTEDELTDANIEAYAELALSDFTIELLGEAGKVCQKYTSSTASWVKGEECSGGVEEYEIMLPDGECGKGRLEELEANYPNGIIVEIKDSEDACFRKYKMIVETENLVCEACTESLSGTFFSEQPTSYDGAEWVLINGATTIDEDDADCRCGIRFIGKEYKSVPSTSYEMYKYPFVEDSTSIIGVSAGFQDADNLVSALQPYEFPYPVYRVREKKNRDMLAGNLLPKVAHSNMYSHGISTGLKKMKDDFFGMPLPFRNLDVQCIQYVIEIEHNSNQQGFQSNSGKDMCINIFAEVGQHYDVEGEINLLATSAGVGGILTSF